MKKYYNKNGKLIQFSGSEDEHKTFIANNRQLKDSEVSKSDFEALSSDQEAKKIKAKKAADVAAGFMGVILAQLAADRSSGKVMTPEMDKLLDDFSELENM